MLSRLIKSYMTWVVLEVLTQKSSSLWSIPLVFGDEFNGLWFSVLLLIIRNSHFKSILRLYFSDSISNKLNPLGRASLLSHFIHDFLSRQTIWDSTLGSWLGVACVPLVFLLSASLSKKDSARGHELELCWERKNKTPKPSLVWHKEIHIVCRNTKKPS